MMFFSFYTTFSWFACMLSLLSIQSFLRFFYETEEMHLSISQTLLQLITYANKPVFVKWKYPWNGEERSQVNTLFFRVAAREATSTLADQPRTKVSLAAGSWGQPCCEWAK